MSSLLEPTTLGDSLQLRNRICMGSMTRNRCVDDNKPTEATARHYAMRARDGAGLIIAEGTFVYLNGGEWLHAPVMYNESHAKAWKPVTDAVHREGGKILFQPWHPGRIQNENMPMLKDSGYPVLAPSKIKAAGGKYRLLDGIPGHTSNITEIKDPNEIIDQYKASVRLAKDAGFDGVEILAQGGYVLHNFLCTHANSRTDKYGGSVENRCRFVLEVLDGVIEAWGSPRQVGIKICPSDDNNDTTVSYDELSSTYDYLIRQMMTRRLGFINLSRRGAAFARLQDDFFKAEARPAGKELPPGYDPVEQFGHLVKYPGSPTMLMVNYEYTVEEGEELVRAGKIDLISFARPFIYNPDLISRIKQGLKLATNNRGGTVNYGPYAHVDENYNDWPSATGEVVKA